MFDCFQRNAGFGFLSFTLSFSAEKDIFLVNLDIDVFELDKVKGNHLASNMSNKNHFLGQLSHTHTPQTDCST